MSPLQKAAGATTWQPTRPLGGWMATFGQIADDGTVVPTRDREGHIFEAARTLGRIDFSEYLKKGKWNDKHDPIYVGVPTLLEHHDETSPLAKAHRKVGYWTEGHLFDRNDPRSWLNFTDYEPTETDLRRADHFWNLATLLKGQARPLGFSAHGKMLVSPCSGRIIWAKFTDNAVCEMPQNPSATAMALRLASPAGLALRPEMVGAAPCADCRCPPGARCAVLDTRKAAASASKRADESATPNADAAALSSDPDELATTFFERLVANVQEQFRTDEATARRWCRQWLASRAKQTEHTQEGA